MKEEYPLNQYVRRETDSLALLVNPVPNVRLGECEASELIRRIIRNNFFEDVILGV